MAITTISTDEVVVHDIEEGGAVAASGSIHVGDIITGCDKLPETESVTHDSIMSCLTMYEEVTLELKESVVQIDHADATVMESEIENLQSNMSDVMQLLDALTEPPVE